MHGNTIIRIPRRSRFVCHNRHPEKTIGCGHRRRRGKGHLIITLDLRSRWQYRRPLYAIPAHKSPGCHRFFSRAAFDSGVPVQPVFITHVR
ncbi:Uncharacterised protein [Shigella sonnei]|nr:Uncharacterised protein [Shigella sonnei]